MNVWVQLFTAGGVGAAAGSIGTAIVQSMSSRGEAKAQAADRVTNAAGNLAERLDKMNSSLDERLARSEARQTQMRHALAALSDAVEDLLPLVNDVATRQSVQDAVNQARAAFR